MNLPKYRPPEGVSKVTKFEMWVVGVYSIITALIIGYGWPFLVLTVVFVTVVPLAIAALGQSDALTYVAMAVAVVAFIVLYIGLVSGAVYIDREGHALFFYLWPPVWLAVSWRAVNCL